MPKEPTVTAERSVTAVVPILSAIEELLSASRKRQRDDVLPAADREAALAQHMADVVRLLCQYGVQLTPIAKRIARVLMNASTSHEVASPEAWETGAVFCTYFPSSGAALVAEIMEQILIKGALWDFHALGADFHHSSPRLDALATMIIASGPFIPLETAQKFASRFALSTTSEALAQRSAYVGGALVCLPHSITNVLNALLTTIRPCPPSFIAECVDRTSGHHGATFCHALAKIKGHGAGTRAALPFAACYRLAQESLVTLRATLSHILNPTAQPYYKPPATAVLEDSWCAPLTSASDEQHPELASVVVEAPQLPRLSATATTSVSVAAPTPSKKSGHSPVQKGRRTETEVIGGTAALSALPDITLD